MINTVGIVKANLIKCLDGMYKCLSPSFDQISDRRFLLVWGAGAALGEGFGDGFGAFWAGEGLVEAFEDVAAGFAEEGVLVLPFMFLGGFWHF